MFICKDYHKYHKVHRYNKCLLTLEINFYKNEWQWKNPIDFFVKGMTLTSGFAYKTASALEHSTELKFSSCFRRKQPHCKHDIIYHFPYTQNKKNLVLTDTHICSRRSRCSYFYARPESPDPTPEHSWNPENAGHKHIQLTLFIGKKTQKSNVVQRFFL